MGIVLNEPPHTGEATQSARCLVSMENAKLCHPEGELLVGTIPGIEDDAVSGAVHWFETKLLLVDIQNEHVLFVVLLERGFQASRSIPG